MIIFLSFNLETITPLLINFHWTQHTFCIIVTEQQTKLYTPEERILMSSIFYLAFPSLIKKLDYCLKEPVPYKKSKTILFVLKIN